jgi:hypothetical protein
MLARFYPTTGIPDPDWWEALWPRPNKVVAALGVQPGGEAVDLCRGDGLYTVSLAPRDGSSATTSTRK